MERILEVLNIEDAPGWILGLLTVAVLLWSAQKTTEGLSGLVRTSRSWIARRRHRTARLEIEGDSIELAATPSAEQQRQIEAWLRRHGASNRVSVGGIVVGEDVGVVAGGDVDAAGREKSIPRARAMAPSEYMPTAVSGILLIACLWVLLSSNYESATENWASGCIGAIVGFWLRDQSAKA